MYLRSGGSKSGLLMPSWGSSTRQGPFCVFACACACVCRAVSPDLQPISRIFFLPRDADGQRLLSSLCSAFTSSFRPLPRPRVSLDRGGRGRDLPMRAAAVMLLWDL